MSRTSRVLLVVVLSAAAAWPRPACAQSGGWWKSPWKARRVMNAAVPEGVEADEPVAVARFLTHGCLNEDGGDIRVIARGREVPSRVLHVGPGDEVRIAFQLLVGVDAYQVYYGNPKATPPAYDWDIRAGLLMEVRKYRGGGFNDLRQALATWDRSAEVLGVDFVPRVYFGHNPFGPTGAFMSRYAGWLRVEKPGRYEFATSSSNGSFLLVDGTEVVSWPGWHGPIPRARHRGTIDLKPGRHKLEYYHIHPSGDGRAVAAWQPPDTLRPVVIPAEAFLPVTRAVVQPAETYRQQVTPDFDFKRREAPLELDLDTFLHRYSFRDISGHIDRRYYRPLWDFGDGIEADVWIPDHVYLAAGTYTVTYRLKGVRGTFTTVQRIVVERDWTRQTSEEDVETLEQYYPIVSAYDFAGMPSSSLRAVCEMFERLGKYDDVIRVGRVLLFGSREVDDDVLSRETERLAGVYLDKRRDAASAIEVYLNGARRVKSADRKARLETRAGRVALEETSDAPRAKTLFEQALSRRDAVRPETRRHALLGLAEVAVLTGDAGEARRLLAEADAIDVTRPREGGAAVRVGSLSRAVEDYLRRNEFQAATELLDTWEWEYPLDRLVGYSTLLRARLHVQREEYARAARLLTSLVRVNPKSNYAAEALMTAAACRLKLGDNPGARDTYNRVLTEYPESPYVKDALKRLEQIR